MLKRLAPVVAVLLAVVAAPLPAKAQELEGPRVTRARGLTTLTFRGTLPTELAREAATLVVVLRRGDQRAAIGSVEVNGGACTVEIRTARVLAPAEYVLEVSGAAAKLTHSFRLGEAADAEAASERLRGWYRGAGITFRELTAALERRGSFHRALIARDESARAGQQATFADFLARWQTNLRMARMDLATYQRRLLLPDLPEAGADLIALVPALLARAETWTASLEPFGKEPSDNARVEAIAARLLKRLGQAPTLSHWRAGALGIPPCAERPGAGLFESALGYRITIPEGAEVKPPRTPFDRLELAQGKTFTAIVRVQSRPDETTTEERIRRLETDAWETWDSYKRLLSEPLTENRGLRLEFQALYRGQRVAVIQLSRFDGERVITLLVFRSPTVPVSPEQTALEASFGLRGDR